MKHLSIQTKLNLVTQFLLTNKTDESKIELIIDLANYYSKKQEWNLVMNLLNNCTHDSEEFNSLINNNCKNINEKSLINNCYKPQLSQEMHCSGHFKPILVYKGGAYKKGFL